MNITSIPLLIEPASISPELEHLGHETIRALAFLLIPIELLYFSIYFLLQGQHGLHKKLTLLSLGTFWLSNWMTPISCGPIGVWRNFIGTYSLRGPCTAFIPYNHAEANPTQLQHSPSKPSTSSPAASLCPPTAWARRPPPGSTHFSYSPNSGMSPSHQTISAFQARKKRSTSPCN
jgi:hypothetical protein